MIGTIYKNIGNFLVRGSFQTGDQPGTFKCAHSQRKTCPFIHNVQKMSEPNGSIKITYPFAFPSLQKSYTLVKQGDDKVTGYENTFAT